VLQIGPKILTLNFVPDLAAPIILSTRAAAIWFFTGPSFPVFDMLEVQISMQNSSRIRGSIAWLTRTGSLQGLFRLTYNADEK
jgi:hypothetical protein